MMEQNVHPDLELTLGPPLGFAFLDTTEIADHVATRPHSIASDRSIPSAERIRFTIAGE